MPMPVEQQIPLKVKADILYRAEPDKKFTSFYEESGSELAREQGLDIFGPMRLCITHQT